MSDVSVLLAGIHDQESKRRHRRSEKMWTMPVRALGDGTGESGTGWRRELIERSDFQEKNLETCKKEDKKDKKIMDDIYYKP